MVKVITQSGIKSDSETGEITVIDDKTGEEIPISQAVEVDLGDGYYIWTKRED